MMHRLTFATLGILTGASAINGQIAAALMLIAIAIGIFALKAPRHG